MKNRFFYAQGTLEKFCRKIGQNLFKINGQKFLKGSVGFQLGCPSKEELPLGEIWAFLQPENHTVLVGRLSSS